MCLNHFFFGKIFPFSMCEYLLRYTLACAQKVQLRSNVWESLPVPFATFLFEGIRAKFLVPERHCCLRLLKFCSFRTGHSQILSRHVSVIRRSAAEIFRIFMICCGKIFEFSSPNRFGNWHCIHYIIFYAFQCSGGFCMFEGLGPICGILKTTFQILF